MAPPARYEFRAATPANLDAVAEVILADDLDDSGESVLDADFLRDEWSRPGFDLATDGWVAVDGADTIVAYGHAVREQPTLVESWGVVHPEHRGRGIGSSLLDRIEERASELVAGLPSARFRHAINAGDRAAAAMLEARGLRLVRHFWHMQIELVEPLEAGPAPEGIEIAATDAPADLPDVYAVINEAFADHWGEYPGAFNSWSEMKTASPSYDPTLWLLATHGGEAVAALTASVERHRGWVMDLGVLAPYRGRGIGAVLLRRSFANLAGRGARRALLSVDAENPTGATALYERAGMRVVKRWDAWERTSCGSADLSGHHRYRTGA